MICPGHVDPGSQKPSVIASSTVRTKLTSGSKIFAASLELVTSKEATYGRTLKDPSATGSTAFSPSKRGTGSVGGVMRLGELTNSETGEIVTGLVVWKETFCSPATLFSVLRS